MATDELNPITLVGLNSVQTALASARVEPRELLLRQGISSSRVDELICLARKRGVPFRTVSRDALDRLSGDVPHQGVAISIREWPYLNEQDLPGSGAGPAFLLILDHLQDAGNVGAILRSAHLCGVGGVVIPKARAVQITSAVVRASAGAAVYLDVYRVANLGGAMRRLKESGVWVFGLEAGGGKGILETDLAVPLALVIGGEHQGLSRLVRERCDLLVSLPMGGRTGSFNASVAAALAMFEVMRQRLASLPRLYTKGEA